jgi:hypothetical protein
MLTFTQLREKMGKGMPPGEHVFDTKMDGKTLMIHKEKDGEFCVYIDMEKLDTYPTLGMAKKAGMEFIKAAKK